ncbi:N-acetyl-beta-hexosaminidase [Aequorivita sublithincola DSM 14238]|uniref:beta-N-acetylhexosaminidase n=1 Tax=Aequorivita sublithincola (strain DSM 14238 / LMG 21431 / ACAM 643 / 9-3) TaxID=746697 RepID=I3YUB8_AEQSU|nr:family 20 glycosylhydrolase [Aequorivita sublithincola]AFL80586.1 N-acetyl-beta-hexosaminidase [Aequorivita sublithincola DSM 14238]
MRNILAVILTLYCINVFSQNTEVELIPKPQSIELKTGTFTIDKKTTIYFESEFEIAGNFLNDFLQNGAGFSLKKASEKKADIIFKNDASQPSEGYFLDISDSKIVIKASDASGAFYAVQTLRQLLPPQLEAKDSTKEQSFTVPQLMITDFPKFQYRGMHLDVSRHFFDKEFVKKYIANLALLKMNRFHWHLTDDQGWRIEIKKYPELTKKGAFREETLIGHYEDKPQLYDGKRYGGFYTQEEIKEVVAFAATQNITIIPEIEMPGHAQAAIHSYPELGCTGEQIPVATTWGVFEDIFCPKEETFTFLENVLSEVMPLFPGEYIHIGGDEALKLRWKNCAHCQQLIQDKNLVDEHGLQSYFIHRIEEFVNSKGKKIIGWDEILEGGLAPNATVMSWRGLQGGIDAAKQNHDVIMTPVSHCYFDYYQSENLDEPTAIGGFLPLKKVYSFNPIPAELNQEQAKHILGAQGNLWTEYIPTEKQVEYMVFPRILAMSEVDWSGPSKNFEKDYPDFFSRVEGFMKRLDALDINYANYLYEIEGEILKENGQVFYELSTPTKGKQIHYSINNSEIQVYSKPILIEKDSKITANVFKEDEKLGRDFSEEIKYHKGITAEISINIPPNPAYAAGGKEALINGISGSNKRYGDKEWLGFWGDDLEITIDLGKDTEIHSLETRFFNSPGVWIYSPKELSVSCKNSEGKEITYSKEILVEDSNKIDVIVDLLETKSFKTRFIKLKIPNYGMIPDGLQGAGHKAWTFIDEIIIK